jgi:hypothetical protein
LAHNGKIVDSSKKDEKLIIKIAVVQTRSMHSVLELDHDKDRTTMNCPEVRAFRMNLEVLEDRNNRTGGREMSGCHSAH